MDNINFTIVGPLMVWLWYYENGNKCIKELYGIDAIKFIESKKTLIEKIDEQQIEK